MFAILIFVGNDLKCYYCDGRNMDGKDSCSQTEDGVEVTCQRNDPNADHYGNACVVAHTGNSHCPISC